MKESDIFNKLKKLPGDWQRIESANTGSGIPDVNGIIGGIEFWIELKIGIPRLRPAQVAWHTRARASKRRCFVLTYYPRTLSGYFQLYRPTLFGPIGQSHLTPLNGTLVRSEVLSDLTNYLTKTYE